MLKQKGVVFLTHNQRFDWEKNSSKFFILVTSDQIFVFGIKGLGEHICKKFE
jgi:hypothetical protein